MVAEVPAEAATDQGNISRAEMITHLLLRNALLVMFWAACRTRFFASIKMMGVTYEKSDRVCDHRNPVPWGCAFDELGSEQFDDLLYHERRTRRWRQSWRA
jgi:hypothetical protein